MAVLIKSRCPLPWIDSINLKWCFRYDKFQGPEHLQTALSNRSLEVRFRIIPKKVLSSLWELCVVSEHFRLNTFGSYLIVQVGDIQRSFWPLRQPLRVWEEQRFWPWPFHWRWPLKSRRLRSYCPALLQWRKSRCHQRQNSMPPVCHRRFLQAVSSPPVV